MWRVAYKPRIAASPLELGYSGTGDPGRVRGWLAGAMGNWVGGSVAGEQNHLEASQVRAAPDPQARAC